jgi:hypothetical protein
MRLRFRVSLGNWLTGGLHFVILALAAQAKSAAVWPYALAAMSFLSFAAWMANYRRLRHIADTPTSRVASAAQGYVELSGRADHLPGDKLLSKLTHVPCAWFRYQIETKTSDDKWSHEESGESDDPFLLIDETGQCVIDPEGAEIITSHDKVWISGSYRYTESLLLPRDRLYAIGAFSTIGGAHSPLDANTDLGALLAEWKSNRPRLLERFDLDRSGELDLEEWELARRQARREVESRHAEIRMTDGTHVMRNPADGRLFLVSNLVPEKLHRRYHIWSWVHIVILFGAGSAALVLL